MSVEGPADALWIELHVVAEHGLEAADGAERERR
jgi:hypothetical protein